jgi:Tfp pilus assembly protein PilF
LEITQEQCCPQCGRPTPPSAPCRFCAESRGSFHVRPLFLLALLIITAAFCTLTVFAARWCQSRQRQLGRMWFERGQAALANNPRQAVRDFRDALYFSHDNREYRLRLAEALLAANRVREAQSYLITLWQDEPSNSIINLQLARLTAKRGETQAALRYYQGAIYGLWPEGDASLRRRQSRLELIHYLLSLHDLTQAEAELIALTPELPAHAPAHNEVGWLFLQAGNPARALGEFEQALRLNPRDISTLEGAGKAAFNLAQYMRAAHYLERAARMTPHRQATEELLVTCRLILEWNPYAAGVSSRQRAMRIQQAFQQARGRLEQCAAAKGMMLTPGAPPAQPEAGSGAANPPRKGASAPASGSGFVAKILGKVKPGASPAAAANPPAGEITSAQTQQLYQKLAQLRPDVRVYKLERDPQLADEVMGLVSQIETVTAQQCGTPKGPDLALLLLARQAEER